MTKKPFLLLPILFSLALFSCKNENKEIDYNPNINASVESIWGQLAFTDVFGFIFAAANDSALMESGYAEINGAKVFYTAYPTHGFKFDFGGYYLQCPDNCVRRGAFTVSMSGGFNEAGTLSQITYQNYYFEYMELDAAHQIQSQGRDQDDLMAFKNLVTNGTVHVMDTINPRTFSWNCDQQLTWAHGEDTPGYHEDDIFNITGASNGKSSSGASFQAEVTNALHNAFNCNWITSGIQSISTPGLLVTSGQIDFIAADSCSDYVNFFFDGNPFYTQLRRVQ